MVEIDDIPSEVNDIELPDPLVVPDKKVDWGVTKDSRKFTMDKLYDKTRQDVFQDENGRFPFLDCEENQLDPLYEVFQEVNYMEEGASLSSSYHSSEDEEEEDEEQSSLYYSEYGKEDKKPEQRSQASEYGKEVGENPPLSQ